MKYMKYIVSLIAVCLCVACSNTKVTSSWKASDVTAGNLSMKKIMVAALLPDRNRELQKSMERQLVADLKSKGVDAMSAYEAYGPKYLPQDEQKAVAKLRESG